MDAKPQRRRFRFSLRTLLVLVMIASAGFGWLGYKVRLAQRQREAVEAIRKHGGMVIYDYEYRLIGTSASSDQFAQPPGPAWLRSVVGIDFLSTVTSAHGRRSSFTNKRLDPLQELPELEVLSLYWVEIRDGDLVNLGHLTKLKSLSLLCPNLSDAGLVHLRGLSKLQFLDLSKTNITDAAVMHLQGLTELKELRVPLKQVSLKGCDELRQVLPNAEILRYD